MMSHIVAYQPPKGQGRLAPISGLMRSKKGKEG